MKILITGAAGFIGFHAAKALLARAVKQLAEQQEMLYAQDRWGVLLVFQAMDAAGKDGTIKHVMSGVNPQGVEVHSFKEPTAEELQHDFLWRINLAAPRGSYLNIGRSKFIYERLRI